MENQFERTELLLGKDAVQILKNAHEAVLLSRHSLGAV